MRQTLIDTLLGNAVVDFKKTGITKYERAQLLSTYMRKHNMGMSVMGRYLGVPKTTIHYWLKWEKMPPVKHSVLLANGITETQITNALKCNKDVNELKPTAIVDRLCIIQTLIKRIKLDVNKQKLDMRVVTLLKEIKQETNRLLMKVEKELSR